MFFEAIFREFYEQKVRYLVIGGMAVNLYGYSRMTGDLDILLDTKAENAAAFLKSCKALGLIAKLPISLNAIFDETKREEWIRKKNMKAFSLYHPQKMMHELDILIDHDIDFDKAYKKKQMLQVENFHIPLIGLDQLIKLKKEAGRARDLTDIVALKKIQSLRK